MCWPVRCGVCPPRRVLAGGGGGCALASNLSTGSIRPHGTELKRAFSLGRAQAPRFGQLFQVLIQLSR